MALGDTLARFVPQHNEEPASDGATFDTRNGHPVLDYDDSVAEDGVFSDVMPRNYAGGGITVTLMWAATISTSGDVKWNVAFERMEEGHDLDVDSFATAQTVTNTTAGSSGALKYTEITFTAGQIDGIAVGETYRLKVTRDAGVVADTMSGDAELRAVELKES